MRISYKMLAGFLFVSSLIWATGYIAVNRSQDALESAINGNMAFLCDEVLEDLDRDVYNKIMLFQEYAGDLIFQETVMRSNREFGVSATAMLAQREALFSSPAGKGMVKGLKDNSLSRELEEKIRFYERTYGTRAFDSALVTNRYGAAVAHTGEPGSYRHDDAEWWRTAAREGLYIADMVDASNGEYYIDAAIRADDEEGGFLGVIRVRIGMSAMLGLIKEMKKSLAHVDGNLSYTLLTRDAWVIYSTDEYKPFEHVPALILDADKNRFITRSDGYRSFAGLGWVLVVDQKDGGLFAPVVELKERISLFSISVTILAMITGFLISRSISRPLRRLRDAAKRLGGGDLDVRMEAGGSDEIGDLSRAFNSMAEELKGLVESRDKEIAERKIMEEAVRDRAFTDHLTGLPNRLLFMDRLQQILARAVWHKTQGAVLFLDLDRFKVINDTLGHDAGDDLIKTVAERLAASLRDGDTVARLGGDEFTVILQDLGRLEDIHLVIEKIFKSLARPVTLKGHEVFMNASVGVAVFPRDGADVASLIKNADIAMYQAKGKGGSNYQIYSHEMSERASDRMRIEHRLKSGLDRDEFALHYQPQVSARTGRIMGVEALIRWNDPESGMVYPSKFIPVAEETGFIIPLSGWVLRAACEAARRLNDDGASLPVSVNISARVFGETGFVNRVKDILVETGLDPRLLNIEITESTLMGDVVSSAGTMNELKEIGVRFSIDDFGTGYSSLSYLKCMPIDRLKIDKSFIRDIFENSDDKAITTAIIRLAESLDMEVMAEGVETLEQLSFLKSLGCELMQGYLFHRAMPEEDLKSLVQSGWRYSAGPRLELKGA